MDDPRVSSATRPNTLPSIQIHVPSSSVDRRSASRPSPYTTDQHSRGPNPMPIPNARQEVPPPLPPPRYISDLTPGGEDLAWEYANSPTSFGQKSYGSINPSSSLFGGYGIPSPKFKPTAEISLRDARPRHIDEGYHSLSTLALSPPNSSKLHGEEPLMNVVRESVDAYDKSMLQKIARSEPSKGSLTRNPNIPPRNFLPAPISRPLFDSHRRPNKPSPLSVPNGSSFFGSSPIDPPPRWHSASSASPEQQPSAYRSPTADTDGASSCAADAEHNGERTLHRSGSSSIFGSPDDASSVTSRSNRGSYDHGVMEDADMDDQVEETGLKNLNIGSHTPPYSPGSKSSLKRRASSPPREDGMTVSPRDPNKAKSGLSGLDIPCGSPDLFRRNTLYLPHRGSPVQRFHASQGSVSTSSSPRNGSYASSGAISLAGTSVTSVSSYDRMSPSGGLSPFSDPDVGHSPQYTTSPRNQLPRTNHSRTSSETKSASSNRKMSSDSTGHTKHHSMPKLSGVFICECCPKKPKKFDSAEELQMHENEKQYECHYCHNRFKNKNEAERHQNSLHLRRHSWSCAALAGVEAAFHPSTVKASVADVCGYCGEEFPNPANWDIRFDHLTTVHKYGECNKAKKFFRADHFRQHLKHSHAGTSGKWTNMLENACMKDEPAPEPLAPGERRNLARASVISEEEPPDQ